MREHPMIGLAMILIAAVLFLAAVRKANRVRETLERYSERSGDPMRWWDRER